MGDNEIFSVFFIFLKKYETMLIVKFEGVEELMWGLREKDKVWNGYCGGCKNKFYREI